MLSATLAYLVIAAQNQPLISARFEAEPAERLLPKLGKVLKLDLEADSSTKTDVIVIAVKDVKPKDLMDRIAKLTCASWVKDDDGSILLKRTREQMLAQEREEQSYRAKTVTAMKAELAVKLKKMAVTTALQADEAIEQMVESFKNRRDPSSNPNGQLYESRAPHEMLARRIALAIPDSYYAALAFNNNIVFSDKPTAVQNKLPINMDPIYSAYVSECKLFRAAASNPILTNPNTPPYRFLGTQSSGEMPRKVLVRVTPESDNIYSVSCRILGATGVDEGNCILSGRVQFFNHSRKSAKFAEVAPASCRDLLATLQKNPLKDSQPNTVSFVNEECRKRYFNPVNDEPLAALHGGALMASAKERDLNLVAVLSDKTASFLSRIFRTPPETVQEAENWMFIPSESSMPDLQLAIDAKWLEVRPYLPSDLWNRKIARNVYKQQISVYDTPEPSMETLSSLAFNLPDYYKACLPMLPVRLSAYGYPREMLFMFHYPKLRFSGSLLPAQKAALLKGQRLRLGNLNTNQLQVLLSIVYPPRKSMQQIRFEFEGSNMPNPHTASFEPTEALPNGLTPDMELGVSVVDEDRVQVSFNEGNDELLDMTAVAGEMINQEAGNPSQRAQIRSFQVKKTRLLTMTVYFGPGAKGEIEYPAEVISSGAKVDRIDKLPAAILKQIDNEKAELLRPKKSGQ